jgi:hypothetical protein
LRKPLRPTISGQCGLHRMESNMKSLPSTVLAAALLGIASVNTVQASPSSNAAFADEYATWQRLVSSNAAYRAAAPDIAQPAADPIARPASAVERNAMFRSEENAWQSESRSDQAPDPTDVQATKPVATRESMSQSAREFADQERTDQQLVSGNAMYRGGAG